MATRTFVLEEASVDPPVIVITLQNGARLEWTWPNISAVKDWLKEVEDIDSPEVLLRYAIEKLRQIDPTLETLPEYVGKTFELTTPSVRVLP